MDTQSKDILKQLLERLDKMDSQQHKLDSQQHKLDSQQHKLDSQQHKLDRVIERLDTLQNIIERQNQKQNSLNEKLVEMTIKRQQEEATMAEQLQEALQEIVEPFRVTESQEVSTPSPDKTTQPLPSLGIQIGEKLKSIEDRTVDTSETCHQLISWSHKMEDKMKTFLLEMRFVKDLIKGQINSELIVFNNRMDEKLSDIASVVRDVYQQQTEAKEEAVRSTGLQVNTDMQHGKQLAHINESLSNMLLSKELCDKQMQVILDVDRKIEQFNSSVLNVSRDVKASLDTILTTNKQSIIDLGNRMSNFIEKVNESCKEQSLLLNKTLISDFNKHFELVQSELQTNRKTVITESETQTKRIICAAETAKEDLRHLIQTEGDNTSKYKVEMESLHFSINSLLKNSIKETIETVVKKVDSTEASMISKHQTMNKKFENLTTELKDYICETKREIFAVTEKEAQIVRNRIQGPLPCHGKYTFDFYVTNFKTLVRSGKDVDSLPWHINELQTCVTGCVRMSTDGEMKVWLTCGRHPREVGLQPRSGKTLLVKATICDIYKKKLPPVDVGENSRSWDEAGIPWNGGVGFEVGVTSCDVLLEGGYGKQERYDHGALLIRFEVTVQ